MADSLTRRFILFADCAHELADMLCQDMDDFLMSRQVRPGPWAQSLAHFLDDPVSHQLLQAAATTVRGLFPASTLEHQLIQALERLF